MAEDMFEELLRRTREDYDSLVIPVAAGEVTIEERMLSMPDGVRLKTYIFHMGQDNLRGGDRAWPVILQRSPYFMRWIPTGYTEQNWREEGLSILFSAVGVQGNRKVHGSLILMKDRMDYIQLIGLQNRNG